jgi:ATP synthase protein I
LSNTDKKSTSSGFGEGYTLGLNLVVSTLVGGGMGYGLDVLFGTLPLFLLLMMLFGFVAGMRSIWQGLAKPKESQETPTEE